MAKKRTIERWNNMILSHEVQKKAKCIFKKKLLIRDFDLFTLDWMKKKKSS